MAAARDLYAILGVGRGASREEIQRVYRRLVRRFHPDVSVDPAAAERFREIVSAYEVLSDPQARARYDRGAAPVSGTDGRPRGRPVRVRTGGFAAGDPWDAGPWGSGGGADLEAEIEIRVENAYTGGRGEVSVDTAAGVRHCVVTVPPGAIDGTRIRLPGLGAFGAFGPSGDLYLVVRLAPHPRYRVAGRELSVDLPVTPWEAALGATVPVDTPGGQVKVEVPPGSSTGRRLRLRGRGLPDPRGTPGDLYAEVKIMIPAALDAGQRAMFERLAECFDFDPRASPDGRAR